MSKQDEAALILQLYDLRREDTMRVARDWFFREFNPQSMADLQKVMFGPHSGHMRMVSSYWDMAAAMVNHGAISLDFFTDTNGEYYMVYCKFEPFLPELRASMSPQFLLQLERLIDATPQGRERVARTREMMKMIQEQLSRAASQG